MTLGVNEAISRVDSFKAQQKNGVNGKMICAAKKIIFENYQSRDLDATKAENLNCMIEAIRYIVEEVLELTPAEYDAIYSTALNSRISLDHAIRKIVNEAPSRVATEALFDNKAILFRMCWPSYYAEHYSKPTAMQVFNASGEVKGNLIRAGRIREIPKEEEDDGARLLQNGKFACVKKEKKKVHSHGEEVDKIVFWAMKSILPLFEMKTPDLFFSLAKPRAAKWTQYGFVKIIEARGCYPSPLDFYMWNHPAEYQMEHIEEYMEARKKAGLKPLAMLDYMYEAYQRSKEKEELEY